MNKRDVQTGCSGYVHRAAMMRMWLQREYLQLTMGLVSVYEAEFEFRSLMAWGKKLLLSLSVFAIMLLKRLPYGSKQKRWLPGWVESLRILGCVCVCEWVSECVWVSVCMWVRVRVRVRVRVSVCVCVCVCVWERVCVRECVCERVCVRECVWESVWERVCERECVRECVWESECVSVSVCVFPGGVWMGQCVQCWPVHGVWEMRICGSRSSTVVWLSDWWSSSWIFIPH